VRHDIVAVEHGPRRPPARAHSDTLRDAGPAEVARRGAAKIMHQLAPEPRALGSRMLMMKVPDLSG
jgi:hypothetical protein